MVVRDVATRWNWTLEMAKRGLLLKEVCCERVRDHVQFNSCFVFNRLLIDGLLRLQSVGV